MRARAGGDVDVGEVSGHDEAVVADEGVAGCADAFLAVRGEGDVRGAGVSAIERPFGFAVADDEDTGGDFLVGHGCECCRYLKLAVERRSNGFVIEVLLAAGSPDVSGIDMLLRHRWRLVGEVRHRSSVFIYSCTSISACQ